MRKKQKHETAAFSPAAEKRLRTAAAVARAAARFQLPAEAVARLPHLELTGNRELRADGVCSVASFRENEITLDCGRLTVKVTGASLCIERYLGDSAIVTGIVTDVAIS